MLMIRTIHCWMIAGSLSLMGLAGCASLHLPWDKNYIPVATAQNPAVQIVCLWEQGEGRDPEGLPCRGFAGQILFLSRRQALPVKIDGKVRIYLFDDVGSIEEQGKPLRTFEFSPEAWNLHLSKSAIGPSYSVFIPYVRRGQSQAKCTLQVFFYAKDGGVLFSDSVTLPLRTPAAEPDAMVISDVEPNESKSLTKTTTAHAQSQPKSTTIPLMNTKSGKLALAQEPAPTTSFKSTDATSTGATSTTTVDDRLARMERLLESAISDRTLKPVPTSPANHTQQNSVQQASFSEPVPEPNPSPRFKLNQPSE